MASAKENPQLVVGVDFGTTYTGMLESIKHTYAFIALIPLIDIVLDRAEKNM